MEKLKVLLVGTGNIGQNAHIPVWTKLDNAQIVAVCDWNYQRALDCAKKIGVPENMVFTDAETAIQNCDCDAVDICVWNRSHMPVCVAAAKAGKHVLCEKPMAWDVASAEEMLKTVKESGVTFMLAMVSRYGSDVQLAHQMMEEGKFGDIYYAKTGSIRRRGTPLGWFTDTAKSGGGPVIDIGVHCIDRTWYLMGCPKPTRVSAQISKRIGDYQTKGVSRWIALDSDVTAFDTEDSAAGVIHFENGACMVFEVSWALNAPDSEYTQICGDKGGATFDPLTIYGEDFGYLTDNKPTTKMNQPFEAEIRHFVDCALNHKTPISTPEQGLQVMKMLMGIYESAKLGREVEL